MSEIRKLSSILFADIQGYTALMQEDEARALHSLGLFKDILESVTKANSGNIIQFFGDGCLMSFDSAAQGVSCAVDLQTAFIKKNIPVRMGMHLGDVVFKDENAFGDGVNIASRIESLGIPGSILVSKTIRDQLVNKSDFLLLSLGSFQFKNVSEPMEVFALANEGFIVPRRNEIKGKIKQRKSEINWRTVLISVLILVAGIFIWQNRSQESHRELYATGYPSTKISDASLAVLPFTSMSSDEENKSFTDGMHDDLLTHLSKIGSIKVISRTSVTKYRNTDKTSPEIASELGVAHLLEGSVRRAGKQIRINVQLIEASTDDHIWSEIYDRELTTSNIFQIQTEIAQAIAKALETTIKPAEEEAMSELPTENLEAYEAYLLARQLMETRNRPSLTEAKALFEKAVELDPEFALAYVHLGTVHYLLNLYGDAEFETSVKLARENLDKGMKLEDNLAEAYAIKAFLIARVEKDLSEAEVDFKKAIAINPNYETTYFWYSIALNELSDNTRKSLAILQNALRINPVSPILLNGLANIYKRQKEFRKVIQTCKKGLSIEPDFPDFNYLLYHSYIALGHLDSAAIAIYEVKTSHAKTRYLSLYFDLLFDLEMESELEQALADLKTQNESDSLNFLQGSLLLNQLQHKFDQCEILCNQYPEYTDYCLLDTYMYGRDFEGVLRTYEQIYQSVNSEEHIASLEYVDYWTTFQFYLYSLQQTGQKNRLEKVWKEFEDLWKARDKEFEESADFYVQKDRLLFIFDLMLNKEEDKAIKHLEGYFEGEYFQYWRSIQMNPAYDELRDHSRFQKLFTEVKANIAIQRENFRAYLKAQKQRTNQEKL